MDWLKEHPEVKTIRVAAADLNGVARGKRIPARYAHKVFDEGTKFPYSVLNLDIWGEDVEDSPLVFEIGDDEVGTVLPQRVHPGPRMSEMVIHNETVYLSGQIADDGSTDVESQTRDVLRQIDALLAEAGTDKSKLLTATIYLADIGTFAEMNKAWDTWVDPANAPARATVEARLAAPEYLVEIQVVAAR